MNNKNLIPTNKRSKEEARELGAKGGKKSGEVRKQKSELKKIFIQYAKMRPTDKEAKQLQDVGFEENDLTNMTFFAVSLLKNAEKGKSKALELAYEMLNDNNKKELEVLKLQEEIEKLKLEKKKIEREIGIGKDNFEDLTPLAELIRRKEK